MLGALPPDGRLAAVPGFNSFRMIDIIERIERRLGVEAPAEDLVPENLTHLDGIVAMFTAHTSRTEEE